MPDLNDQVSQMANNQSLLDWLRGKAQGRGVPTWTDAPNTGKYGGFQGWQPGMPRAPGNSPGVGRFGGTYTPSGASPVPPAGGGPPGYPLGSGIPGTGPWSKGFAPSQLGLALPMGMLASQPDRAHVTQDQMISGLAKWRAAQQGIAPPSATAIPTVQSGGALPPVVPTAPPPVSAPVASNAPRVPVTHPLAPQPTQPWPSQTVAQSLVPVPRPRPQPTVPIPTPRPQMAQQTPRPTPTVQGNQLDQVLKSLFGRPISYNQQAVNTSNL